MEKYDINEKSYDAKDLVLGIIYESYSDEIDKEIETIYQKAEAFDEIANELHYQLQKLEIWDTLDQKDCQTLKQILEENTKEEKQMERFKVKRIITTEEVRYIDAETEEDAWYSVEYEDEGTDTAHFNAEYGEWSYEKEDN